MTLPYGISRGYDRSRKSSPWYVRVNGRKVAHFRSESERDTDYNNRLSEAKLYGQLGTAQLSGADRVAIQEMNRLAADVDMTPLEIFQRGMTLSTGVQRNVKELERAREAFMAYVKTREKSGYIRKRRAALDFTLGFIVSRVASFRSRLGLGFLGLIGRGVFPLRARSVEHIYGHI